MDCDDEETKSTRNFYKIKQENSEKSFKFIFYDVMIKHIENEIKRIDELTESGIETDLDRGERLGYQKIIRFLKGE